MSAMSIEPNRGPDKTFVPRTRVLLCIDASGPEVYATATSCDHKELVEELRVLVEEMGMVNPRIHPLRHEVLQRWVSALLAICTKLSEGNTL